MDTLIFIFQLIVALLSGVAVFAALVQTIDNFGSLIKNKCLVFIFEDETHDDGYIQETLFWKTDKKRILSFLFYHAITTCGFMALFIYMIMELIS